MTKRTVYCRLAEENNLISPSSTPFLIQGIFPLQFMIRVFPDTDFTKKNQLCEKDCKGETKSRCYTLHQTVEQECPTFLARGPSVQILNWSRAGLEISQLI